MADKQQVVLGVGKTHRGILYKNDFPCPEELQGSYLRSLVLESRSPHSIKTARSTISIFLKFLKSQGIRDLRQVSKETLRNFEKSQRHVTKVDGAPLSPGTILGRMCGLLNLFFFLKKKGYLLFNPMEGYELPKKAHSLPRAIMTGEEMKKMLFLPNSKTYFGYRDRTIMEVLYSTGIRGGELCQLKLGDVSLLTREIRVERGKGGKPRIVPLTGSAVRFLEGYLGRIRPKILRDKNCPYVFLNFDGKKFHYRSLSKIIFDYRNKAGMKKQVTAHSFRHTVATQLLQAGMDVRYIQTFLGHSSLRSTQVYTRVAKESLREKFEKFHPRAKIGKREAEWQGDGRLFKSLGKRKAAVNGES